MSGVRCVLLPAVMQISGTCGATGSLAVCGLRCFWGLYQAEYPLPPPDPMFISGLMLLLRAMSGSVVLLQPESVLMSVEHGNS